MVIDLTKTEKYRIQMEEAIKASQAWFTDLGYADAEFDLKAWMIWHRDCDDKTKRSYP